ncbi:MAG: HAD-IA family hydrolase [Chlamydiae bacterium]|nr:HAD-IA family hydrolase [Chlamydiota bacterium]MBI3265828.1 HAD-IA family hydrolase [Chlamydiota bacterium]
MNKTSRFKAIFFDAGGTLVRPEPSVGEIYRDVAARYGCSGLLPDEIESRFKMEWEKRDHHSFLEAHPQEREWWFNLVKDVFNHFGGVKDFEPFFEELYDIFARPEYWRLFPEVEEVLRELKKSELILGIVSNWDSRLIPLCEGLGIGKTFDFILASALVGSSKPHPEIFKEALRRSGAESHEVLHIGDSVKDDVLGPNRIGIQSVLIDRSGKRQHPVPTVRSLKELLPLIFA